jgi:chromosome transmission fidelity protein 18
MKFLTGLVTEEVAKGTRKKKKGPSARLLRPIICICNDAYAPVLRTLRPLAECIAFPTPILAPLVSRLQSICRQEGLREDTHALMTLAELTDGDIRSCLNTLQFSASNGGINVDVLRKTANKDMTKSLFLVWDTVFCLPRSGSGGDSGGKFIDRVKGVVDGGGDYPKILQGCFENYLYARAQAQNFGGNAAERIEKGMDWLSFSDRIDTMIHRDQAWQLMQYSAYPIVAFHAHFAGVKRPKLIFPKADYKARPHSPLITRPTRNEKRWSKSLRNSLWV